MFLSGWGLFLREHVGVDRPSRRWHRFDQPSGRSDHPVPVLAEQRDHLDLSARISSASDKRKVAALDLLRQGRPVEASIVLYCTLGSLLSSATQVEPDHPGAGLHRSVEHQRFFVSTLSDLSDLRVE